MDYQRDNNFMTGTSNADAQSIANMHQQQHQQQQQDLQQKIQQQQHAEQQKLHMQAIQQQQQPHVPPTTTLEHEQQQQQQQQQLNQQMQLLGQHQQQQQQHPHTQIPIEFHHHFQQQQQQQQQHHHYMLQQQFQQHQQQLQQHHHHFQQYQQQQHLQQQQQLQHQQQIQQQQQQQQQHRSPESQNEHKDVTLNQQQQQHLQQHQQQLQYHNQSDINLIRHQEILHAPNLLPQQQQQQQHMNPAIPITPDYGVAHSISTTPAHVASTTLQQQSEQQSQQQNLDLRNNNNNNNNNNTTTVTTYSTIPQTTTLTTITTPTASSSASSIILPTSQNDVLQHYGASNQYSNHINTTNSYMNNNKTDNSLTSIPSSSSSSLTSSLMQPTTSTYGSINGMENAAAYNKFYQTYGQNQFPLYHHHQQQQQQQQQHQISMQQHQLPPLDSTIEKTFQQQQQQPPPPPPPITKATTTTSETVLTSNPNNNNNNNNSYMDTSATTTTDTTTTTEVATSAAAEETTITTTNCNNDTLSAESMKRKSDDTDCEDTPDMKKSLEEKKNLALSHLRKNIRDVMDETQLDTTTLAAQREESERLARVAEQQKVMREYQRQTAVNRQYARTQNRVMSLLQSGKTYAKFTDSTPTVALTELAPATPLSAEADNSSSSHSQSLPTSVLDIKPKVSSTIKLQNLEEMDAVLDEDKSSESTPHSTMDGDTETATVADVVTIEDSSSEDDCILLSDDDDDEILNDEEDGTDDPHNSGLHVQDNYNVPDELGRVIINVGHPDGEEDIFVAPQIAKTIKPHQIGGVRFLFDNIIESTKRFKNSSGFGCILAHSMGLGKTLQVVCFCDIFLRHTNSKTVLCVMPINTLQNWVNEFNMWTPRHSDDPHNVRPRHFDVFVLNDQHKTLSARAKVILRWAEEGGVLLIGYELFRLLALKIIPTRRRRGQKQLSMENNSSEAHKRLTESIYQALVKPGPDLVICDEGHRIKNSHAGISVALKQIRTRRRIVLTGYPLQNNLLEYWCMVDFVRPNYLGTRTEFCNMFERPIQNGQCIDSTPEDIKLMRYRAHVLHSLLMGFVQRRSHMVLQQTLPQKLEYVILTRMTTFQRQLYDTFMNDVVRTRTVPNPLKAFSVCCKIWNHPDVLYNFLKRYEHDLDIEIEEGEIVPEITPITTIAPISKTTSSITNTTTTTSSMVVTTTTLAAGAINGNVDNSMENVATPINNVVPATFVEESQNSSSGFSSMNAPTPTTDVPPPPPKYEQTTIPVANSITTNDATKHNNTETELIANGNHNNSNNNGNNNYWLEPNLPYYTPYPAVMSNHQTMAQPDYVGIMVKPSASGAGDSVHTGSSEIVDLDTNEIKTVETDIDMEPKVDVKIEDDEPPISEKSSNSSKKTTELSSSSCKNEDDDDDDVIIEEVGNVASDINKKSLDSPPLTIAESKLLEKESRWADGVPYDWALDLMKKYEPDLIENSPKMEVFFCILHQSIEFNDRVLLFSQSLLTLNLIERFLQANYVPGTENYWARNTSYFRLDGSTNSQEREKLVTEFNSNYNVKLFLISTRAGSLGINLVGANRVVVFDASWNPCHDTQAVYRIYR